MSRVSRPAASRRVNIDAAILEQAVIEAVLMHLGSEHEPRRRSPARIAVHPTTKARDAAAWRIRREKGTIRPIRRYLRNVLAVPCTARQRVPR